MANIVKLFCTYLCQNVFANYQAEQLSRNALPIKTTVSFWQALHKHCFSSSHRSDIFLFILTWQLKRSQNKTCQKSCPCFIFVTICNFANWRRSWFSTELSLLLKNVNFCVKRCSRKIKLLQRDIWCLIRFLNWCCFLKKLFLYILLVLKVKKCFRKNTLAPN